MAITFGLNGLPLEVKRQNDQRLNPKVSHDWLLYPDAYMYVVAICVATITTILIDRTAMRQNGVPSFFRNSAVVANVFIIVVAAAAYSSTLGVSLLTKVDSSYLKALLGAAGLASLIAVLPDRIADSISRQKTSDAK